MFYIYTLYIYSIYCCSDDVAAATMSLTDTRSLCQSALNRKLRFAKLPGSVSLCQSDRCLFDSDRRGALRAPRRSSSPSHRRSSKAPPSNQQTRIANTREITDFKRSGALRLKRLFSCIFDSVARPRLLKPSGSLLRSARSGWQPWSSTGFVGSVKGPTLTSPRRECCRWIKRQGTSD